ncbi:MAG: hydrogenase expression/formation protein HypE, partial [Candidatus Hydrogenedentota bacterium]
GIAVLSQRGEYGFEASISSDVASLSPMVEAILAASPNVHFMRDLTRGGLAAALNEAAASSGKAIEIDERSLPIRDEVLAACEMLGLDPLQVANEGKCIIICAEEDSETVLKAMRRHECGRGAVEMGRVIDYRRGVVFSRTAIGSKRTIDMPSGRLLPRIC